MSIQQNHICVFVFTALFRPIQGQRKTFEELLEEQLQLEEQRLKTAEQQVAKPVLYIYRNYRILWVMNILCV